ncbi:MAG: STAS domain-containing protein [Proteobacteria bacterium]|nr:STAS domain-containing protein [Pseudomonadota bacterium]
MQLTVTVTERTPGVFMFRPIGSIDTNTYSILEEKVDFILKGITKTMIFDMEGVNYISSAGIRVIIKVQKSMKQRDGQFLMTNLQPQVKKVFEIINALPTMHVFSSIQELDRYLDLMQKKVTGEVD